MYILINDNNYITVASYGGILEDGIEVEDFEFIEPINAYQYKNGKIVLDKNKKEQLDQQEKLYAEVAELKEFLKNTDSVLAQYEEEVELVEAEIIGGYTVSDNERIKILKERHEVRMRLKEIEELILWNEKE
jgi:hypothetical protein